MSLNSTAWNHYPIRVGCPVWRSDGWVGQVYSRSSDQRRPLEFYTRAFGTVEGNSTFYSIPSSDMALKWASQAAPGFHFCFKVPRLISHDMKLRDIQRP